MSATNQFCDRCSKPFVYVGDVPKSGWEKGQEPFCTCNVNTILESILSELKFLRNKVYNDSTNANIKPIKVIFRSDPAEFKEYMPIDENIEQLTGKLNEVIKALNERLANDQT